MIMEKLTESNRELALPGNACNPIKSIYRAKQASEIWRSLLHELPHNWELRV